MKIRGSEILDCMVFGKIKSKLFGEFCKRNNDKFKEDDKILVLLRGWKDDVWYIDSEEVKKILGEKTYEKFMCRVIDYRLSRR